MTYLGFSSSSSSSGYACRSTSRSERGWKGCGLHMVCGSACLCGLRLVCGCACVGDMGMGRRRGGVRGGVAPVGFQGGTTICLFCFRACLAACRYWLLAASQTVARTVRTDAMCKTTPNPRACSALAYPCSSTISHSFGIAHRFLRSPRMWWALESFASDSALFISSFTLATSHLRAHAVAPWTTRTRVQPVCVSNGNLPPSHFTNPAVFKASERGSLLVEPQPPFARWSTPHPRRANSLELRLGHFPPLGPVGPHSG